MATEADLEFLTSPAFLTYLNEKAEGDTDLVKAIQEVGKHFREWVEEKNTTIRELRFIRQDDGTVKLLIPLGNMNYPVLYEFVLPEGRSSFRLTFDVHEGVHVSVTDRVKTGDGKFRGE